MEENQKYYFYLSLPHHYLDDISQIEKELKQIPQGDNVDVTFWLWIDGDWYPSNDETNAVLNLMDEFKCTCIKLRGLMEIVPGLKEILIKSFKTWNSLELRDKFSDATLPLLSLQREFSDAAFKSIVELIIANGGIQRLSLGNITLSNESWELFNSHKLGTGREDSTIEFYQPKLSDEVFAQVLENLSGFKTFQIYHEDRKSCFPKAFRNLGQILSRPDCEVSDLLVIGNCICGGQMLETLTTNSSVKELELHIDLSTDDDLTSSMKQIHKFTRLTDLTITYLKESQPLDFLRPLLDNSSSELKTNPFIETLTILSYGTKRQFSKVKNDLLLQVAQRYPKLRSFGPDIALTRELNYTLCMNSKWRQYMTQEPELPLSFWRFVLEDVEKEPYSSEEEKEKTTKKKKMKEKKKRREEKLRAALVASIRYAIIQHIVQGHITNFVVVE